MIYKISKESKAVYEWEDSHDWMRWNEDLSLTECQRIVNKIRRDFKLKRIRVGDGRGRPYARGDHERGVHLPRMARNIPFIIHETSHTICTELYDFWTHGPVFVTCEIELLSHYMKLPKRKLYRSAKDAGIL